MQKEACVSECLFLFSLSVGVLIAFAKCDHKISRPKKALDITQVLKRSIIIILANMKDFQNTETAERFIHSVNGN